jgi:hypothetical protein
MTRHSVPQRSEAWHRLRTGRVGASEARAILSTVKTGESAARRDLRTAKALERLTGVPISSDYVNADMERGLLLEAEAIWAFELATGQYVEPCGYVTPQEPR